MQRDEIIRRLTAIGGRPWSKNGKDRVYFNADFIYKTIGLDMGYYGTGNISSASLAGKSISNSKARRIISGLPDYYYDLTSGQIMRTKPLGQTVIDLGLEPEVVAAIRAALVEQKQEEMA